MIHQNDDGDSEDESKGEAVLGILGDHNSGCDGDSGNESGMMRDTDDDSNRDDVIDAQAKTAAEGVEEGGGNISIICECDGGDDVVDGVDIDADGVVVANAIAYMNE